MNILEKIRKLITPEKYKKLFDAYMDTNDGKNNGMFELDDTCYFVTADAILFANIYKYSLYIVPLLTTLIVNGTKPLWADSFFLVILYAVLVAIFVNVLLLGISIRWFAIRTKRIDEIRNK